MGPSDRLDHGQRHVAFLRGINMIGRRTVRMADLQASFEEMGFVEVETVLASGNVVFSSPATDDSLLPSMIGEGLAGRLGAKVSVIVRTLDEIAELVERDPFAGLPAGPRTKFLVTFLAERPDAVAALPLRSPDGGFELLSLQDLTSCSVVTLADGRQSSGILSFLERTYGPNQTTRNWSTVSRIARLALGAIAQPDRLTMLQPKTDTLPAAGSATARSRA